MPEAERERDEERARDRERTNSGHPALLIPIRADNKQQSTIRPHTLNPKMVVFLGSLCRDKGLFLPVLPSPGLCRQPEIFIAQLLGALRLFVVSRGKPKRARRGSFWCRVQPSIHDSLSSIAERTVPLLLTTCTSSAIQSRTGHRSRRSVQMPSPLARGRARGGCKEEKESALGRRGVYKGQGCVTAWAAGWAARPCSSAIMFQLSHVNRI